MGYAAGITIDTVNTDKIPVCTLSNPSFNWGTITNVQNASDPGRIDPIGADPRDYVPSMVIAAGAYTKGILYGQNYAQNAAGLSSLTMKDAFLTAVALVSGGVSAPNAVGFSFNTAYAFTDDGAKLISLRNNGDEKLSISKDGVLELKSDTSTARNPTINKPSGRFTLAAASKKVKVTNALVSPASRIFVTKHSFDKTARDFAIKPLAGAFTLTADAAATDSITFDFLIIN